ncbi:BTB/POZ domain-containing protein [Paraphaeosphaeria sporulosa]
MAQTAQDLVLESVKSLLTSGDYSDLTITCQSDSYKVHKAIVCPRAKFFGNAIKFPGKESESNTISLPKDDPAMVKLLIQYLYEGDYFPPCLPSTSSSPSTNSYFQNDRSSEWKKASYHVVQQPEMPHTCTEYEVYCDHPAVCEHHQCGGECDYHCIDFCCAECNPPPSLGEGANQLSTHASMYAIGDQYGVIGLKQLSQEKFRCACLHFWNQSEFVVAAHLVFSTTLDEDKGLRDIVSETISGHMELVNKPEIEVLMTEFSSLAFGLLKRKVSMGWI